ncbi:MAG: hypothetical protein ACYDAN_11385 [Candidatus Limnocylindrales bacterium]
MKKLLTPIAGASLFLMVAAGAVAAATPATPATPAPAITAPSATTAPTAAPTVAPGPLAAILGLTDAEVATLRQQGLSLAQIAARQNVDPQKLIDALVAQWSSRIDARLAVGAITADQAKTLKDALAAQARTMVNQTTLGGMRGAAVGAGPNGIARGMGAGPAANGATRAAGAGWGGAMRGAGHGTGVCPLPTTAPSN